jgi:hypothetical protein
MTTRKENLRLPPRTPAYVDRETGAAEFCVSPETWDRWEKEGRLPSPAPGFPPSTDGVGLMSIAKCRGKLTMMRMPLWPLPVT